jgi:hypothetical protein
MVSLLDAKRRHRQPYELWTASCVICNGVSVVQRGLFSLRTSKSNYADGMSGTRHNLILRHRDTQTFSWHAPHRGKADMRIWDGASGLISF